MIAVIRIGRLYHKYRVILKTLRDFRPLQYSSRDGHAEGEHVNRGRDASICCPTSQVLDMSTLRDASDVKPPNSKIQNAFLFPVHAMFRHDCPPSGETCKYTKTSSTHKNLERFCTYWCAPFCCVCLGCREAEFEIFGGTYELPLILGMFIWKY